MTSRPGHVYIIQLREFINSGENVYKIGRSASVANRLKAYPKGSHIHMIMQCNDNVACERELKSVFDNKFKVRREYGREYYAGDISDMKKEFIAVASKYDTPIDNSTSENSNLENSNTDDISNDTIYLPRGNADANAKFDAAAYSTLETVGTYSKSAIVCTGKVLYHAGRLTAKLIAYASVGLYNAISGKNKN